MINSEIKLHKYEQLVFDILNRHDGHRNEKDLFLNFSLQVPAGYSQAHKKRMFAHAVYGLGKKELVVQEADYSIHTIESRKLDKSLITCKCGCSYQSQVYDACPECKETAD